MPKKTAQYEEHVKLGGRIIDFGGWDLPVQYTGLLDEHTACRTKAALFDVSHMGEIWIKGPAAEKFLNFAITNDITKIPAGKAQYSVMCNENGGIVDDIINYKFSSTDYLMIVNASNSDKDFAHLLSVQKKYFAGERVVMTNDSAAYSQIALQGPMAEKILQPLMAAGSGMGFVLADLKSFEFAETLIGSVGVKAIVSRTGYTGEDGFEIYCPWNDGPKIWRALIEAGGPHGLKPAGLGARDTLRTEMKYSLYGHEITDQTNPLEAGLGWVVKLDKGDFLGKAPLLKVKVQMTDPTFGRKCVGLKMFEGERRIPRQGYKVLADDGRVVGEVTSGTQSPSLNEPIAIAYVESRFAKVGQKLFIEIRDYKAAAAVCATPFYQPKK